MSPESAEILTSLVTRWVAAQPDLLSLALAGSWARGNARPQSDLDLLIMTTDQERYRQDGEWLSAIGFEDAGYPIVSRTSAQYGVAWSWHLYLEPDAEVELTFARLDWASVDPVDAGTIRVITEGFKVLIDKDGRLGALVAFLGLARTRPLPPSAD
jgi:predicted nucleotidyltransferase